MKNKRFVFEITIEGIPYNEETATEIYGENSFNPDFSEECFVREKLSDLFKDALTQRLWFKMQELTKPVADIERHNAYLEHIDYDIELNGKIHESLKLVRKEEI